MPAASSAAAAPAADADNSCKRPATSKQDRPGAALADDGRGKFYSQLAEDGAEGVGRREAALLFSTAEGFFRDGGSADHQEALAAAQLAFEKASASDDHDLLADAARLVVKAYCLQAYNVRYERGSAGTAQAEELLNQAMAFIEARRSEFGKASNRRGLAAMSLSSAEVCLESKDVEVRQDAQEPAESSRKLAKEVGDPKLEALACLVLSDVAVLKKDRKTAVDAAADARAIFQSIHDAVGEARALHAAAMASAMDGSYSSVDAGIRFAQESATLFGSADSPSLQALQMLVVSELSLNIGRAKQALLAAKEAIRTLRQISYGRGFHAFAIGLTVEAHLELDQLHSAMDAAREAAARFASARDVRQEVICRDILAHACLVAGEFDSAMEAIKVGLDLCEDLQDHCLEANLLLTLSEVQLEMDQLDDAVVSAQDASSIFRALDHEWHLAGFAQYQVAKVSGLLGDLDGALEESQLARDFFFKIDNFRCEGLSLIQSASILALRKESIPEALQVVEQAMAIFERTEDRGSQAFALYVSAEMYAAQNDSANALKCASERRSLLQSLGLGREEAKALHALAALHLQNGDAAEAVRSAREGLRLARASGDRSTEVHLQLQVVQSNLQLAGDAEKDDRKSKLAEDALKAAREGVAVSRKIAGGRLKGPALFWAAQAMGACGLVPEAQEAAEDALEQLRSSNHSKQFEPQAMLLLAQVRHARGHTDEAENICREAVALFARLGDTDGEALGNEVLRRIAPSVEEKEQQRRQQQENLRKQHLQDQVDAEEARLAAEKEGQQEEAFDLQAARERIMKITLETIDQEEEVEFDSPLMDMGLDSLSSVSLRNELAKEFQVSLSASVMFDYPSVSALADHISLKVAG